MSDYIIDDRESDVGAGTPGYVTRTELLELMGPIGAAVTFNIHALLHLQAGDSAAFGQALQASQEQLVKLMGLIKGLVQDAPNGC
jgi:hypothetical protein